jgi:hypothetical protein
LPCLELLADPLGAYALTVPDPRFPKRKSTRSPIILNCGSGARVRLSLNPNYAHGDHRQNGSLVTQQAQLT